jgi:tRNA (cmo5U34)-methyltransferase
MMTTTWTEEDSATYQELAPVAVPARAEQLATLLTLTPFARDERFRAVELACGEGYLAHALLELFPQATVVALDGSEEMRARAAERLASFGERASVQPFDLAEDGWRHYALGAGCVLSSLTVHHLTNAGKRRLFSDMAFRLAPRGALLIADLVAPVGPEAQEIFAATWDRAAEAQALAHGGETALYTRFLEAHWNYYRYADDPLDQPASLFEQLRWLREAGFPHVDCFWLQAGHAIYGGYKSRLRAAEDAPRVTYADALAAAQAALG